MSKLTHRTCCLYYFLWLFAWQLQKWKSSFSMQHFWLLREIKIQICANVTVQYNTSKLFDMLPFFPDKNACGHFKIIHFELSSFQLQVMFIVLKDRVDLLYYCIQPWTWILFAWQQIKYKQQQHSIPIWWHECFVTSDGNRLVSLGTQETTHFLGHCFFCICLCLFCFPEYLMRGPSVSQVMD